jgi:hypothetical protein
MGEQRLKVGDWVTGMAANGDGIKHGYITYVMNYWGKAVVAVVQPDYSIKELNCYMSDIQKCGIVVYSNDLKDLMELALYYKDYDWCKRIANSRVYNSY